jgi:hypothetical protein
VIISWKLFWAILGAVLAISLAGLAVLFDLSPLVVIPVTAGAVGTAVFSARVIVHRTEMFEDIRLSAQQSIVRWIGLATAVYAVWVVAFTLKPSFWFVLLVALTAISGLVYWVARMHEYLLTKIVKPSPKTDTKEGARKMRDLDDTEKMFRAALKRIQLGWLQVLGWEPVGGDKPFGVKFTVKKPAERKDPFTSEHADQIANSIGEVLREGGAGKVELATDWVAIEKVRAAGTYEVTVVTEDVMGRIYPYVDDPTPASIRQPALAGYRLDGTPYYLSLRQHGMVVGQSTFGKSAWLNALIAYILRCPDAVLWIAGVEKLYDLVAGWIEVYTNTGIRLPIDWIANGQEDVVKMLVGGMAGARWRQKQPMAQRRWPTVITILDEASFALENRRVTRPYQGIERTAADMVSVQSKGAASGDFFEILASQRDTIDNFGDQGGNVLANMGYVAGFRTRDQNGLGRLMNDYKLPMPRHKGELWLDAGEGELAAHLKGPYIQSIDPTKPRLHDGATVADIAWARRAIEHNMDAGTAAAVDEATGGAYSRRHTLMDDKLMQYLTQGVELKPQTSAAQQEGYDLVMREMAALGIASGSDGLGALPAGESPAAGTVATMVGRKPLRERTVEVVQEIGGRVTREQIVNALRESGDTPDDQVVTNALTKAVKDGLLERPERGVYIATGQ